jgi:hypothetical protein
MLYSIGPLETINELYIKLTIARFWLGPSFAH